LVSFRFFPLFLRCVSPCRCCICLALLPFFSSLACISQSTLGSLLQELPSIEDGRRIIACFSCSHRVSSHHAATLLILRRSHFQQQTCTHNQTLHLKKRNDSAALRNHQTNQLCTSPFTAGCSASVTGGRRLTLTLDLPFVSDNAIALCIGILFIWQDLGESSRGFHLRSLSRNSLASSLVRSSPSASYQLCPVPTCHQDMSLRALVAQ
jgi:hypothetical protein